MKINHEKNKIFINGVGLKPNYTLYGKHLEHVNNFKYPSAMVTENGSGKKEISI